MGLLDDLFGTVPGIGAVTSAIGTLGSIYSQSQANSTNKKLVRETNAQNYKMFQENLQNQWEMWRKNNEYNDPSAQRARLENAGLNPYLMLNGGSTGTAEGSISPTAPIAQAPSVNPVDMNGLGQPFQRYMELDAALKASRMQEAQITGQQHQNEHSALTNFYDLMTLQNRIKLTNLDRETKEFVKDLTRMTAKAYKEDYATERLITKANWQNIVENTALVKEKQDTEKMQQTLMNSNVKLNYQQVSNLRYEIKKILSDIDVNDANIRRISQDVTNMIIKNGVDGINFNTLKSAEKYLPGIIYNDYRQGNVLYRQMQQDYKNPFRYAGGLFGSGLGLIRK